MSIMMTSTTTGSAPSLHSLSLPPPHSHGSASASTSTSSSSALSALDHRQQRRVTHVRQLFVGNLPFRVRWQDLKDMFRKAGPVIRADVALSHDHRSKGHGTVLFATVEDAQNAIDMLHNHKWQGRILEVREDRGFIEPSQPSRQQQQQQHGFDLKPYSDIQDSSRSIGQIKSQHLIHPTVPTTDDNGEVLGGRQLFVGNLPFHCQWQDVKDLFRTAGNILRADVIQDSDGRSRGFGTVLYATHEDANTAIAMYNGYEFHGRQLRVHFDKFAPGLRQPHQHHSIVPYSPAQFRQDRLHHLYAPPPPIASPYFGLSSPISLQHQQQFRSFVDDDTSQEMMLQQLPPPPPPPFPPFPLTFQHHQEFPTMVHSSYFMPAAFPDERYLSEGRIAASTLDSIGMPFMDSTSASLDPNSKLFTPWIAAHDPPPSNGIIRVEEEEKEKGSFFTRTGEDNALSDAVAAMSISHITSIVTTTATAALTTVADESAGLTSPLRSKTASIKGPSADTIPPPPSSLLNSNSVWEPLGGFKY